MCLFWIYVLTTGTLVITNAVCFSLLGKHTIIIIMLCDIIYFGRHPMISFHFNASVQYYFVYYYSVLVIVVS